MADPHDSIRAAIDYDVIIRDALAGVPNSAINGLVERLAELFDDPNCWNNLCIGDICPKCECGPLERRGGALVCPDCGREVPHA